MKRPDDVTDQDISAWEISRQEYIRESTHILIREIPAEVWYAGCWLNRQLRALNCTKELAEQIEAATGQRQSYSKDYWQTAATAVENYKKGIWDTPGEELALRLLHERFGPNPDPIEVLESTLGDGADPEKLLVMALKAKMDHIIRKNA